MTWPEVTLKIFRELITLGCWVAGAYIAYRVSVMVINFIDTWSRFAVIRTQAEVELMRKQNAEELARQEAERAAKRGYQ